MTNHVVTAIMEKIGTTLNENPEPMRDLIASYQFNISDVEEAAYQLRFHNGEATVVKGNGDGKADCTLTMSADSFQKFLSGKLKGTVAFMTGKLNINGDMTLALKLEALLKQYRYKLF